MKNKPIIKSAKKVVPKIYAYSTPGVVYHEGWTKIGYTEKDDVLDRIKEQVQTSDIIFKKEWDEIAVFDDNKTYFNDTEFHLYLTKNGIERRKPQIGNNKEPEWFKISGQDSHNLFYKFRQDRGVLESLGVVSYTLRNEQNEAVKQTKDYFENNNINNECLWNAKPRFGKTLATYDLCKKLNSSKVLVVTNRPAIANSWYEDYVKFLGTESGYYFVSNVDGLKNKKYVLSREKYLGMLSAPNHKGCIEFVSLQDLKGSLYFGGEFEKLKEVAELEWDILVIDEAHEGVDTYKTDVAFDQIKRKYTLHLSGTPFKALANEKFEEQAIYNWTYADEQKAKRDWDSSREEENPYANLPQLNLLTYRMSDIVLEKVKKGADFDDDGENEEYAFDLNEFFDTYSNGKFKHEESVDKFLDALATQEKFPFSTDKLRNELKHTLWLLKYVKSAKALAKKLNEHPIFGNGNYKIVLAAGDGKLDTEELDDYEMDDTIKNSYDKVVNAIKNNDKTITLSVGQLTTGITIPEWTAVMMLSNVKSPALYMQSAFRAQNPCLFNENGEQFRKENAYVFDFDPARTLEIVEKFANDLHSDTANGKGDSNQRKQHVRELLNFFPIYGEDSNGEMFELNAEEVLSIPRTFRSKEVVKRGFMSNYLFQNIGNIFNAPREVLDIISKFDQASEGSPVISEEEKNKFDINDEGEVEIPQEKVIGLTPDVFGEKLYGDLENDLTNAVNVIQNENVNKNAKKDEQLNSLLSVFHNNVTDKLIDVAKEKYGQEMSASTKKGVEKKINTKTDIIVKKHYGSYQIENNKLENDRQKELQQATINNDFKKIDDINKIYNEKKKENNDKFINSIQNEIKEIVENTGFEIVKAVEEDKQTKQKNEVEDNVRAHLRGFARTIPSFIMAYGDENTTLENFDKIIPNNVFLEVTSISLDEFKRLRDGFKYIDDNGEEKEYKGFFDSIVFNDSIKEFLRLKEKLSNYFDENSKEDIFDYIPPQKTNQIFTPKKVVKEMVDNLEKEEPTCFDDPNRTFIDLYMKSGLYITEIVKRLYNNKEIKKLYPNENDRLKHIFAKQVYGLAPTEIIYRIALSYILGFSNNIKIEKHNLKLLDATPYAQQGNLEEKLDEIFEN